VHTTRVALIEDEVWTGPYVYITDQNHGYADPDTAIGRQPPVDRAVSIGAGSWLGAGAIILPGAGSAAMWWWWWPARWSAAMSPTGAWWPASPQRLSANTR
jgi:hypothetical protein